MIKDLIKLADYLDRKDLNKEASYVDALIRRVSGLSIRKRDPDDDPIKISVDDIHEVPPDLEEFHPYEAYGLGHEAGKEHAEKDYDFHDRMTEIINNKETE
tara:strand:+ start:272 stop:574 length:303 start_codon:yes stop_codon:yes gene_type:complete